LNEETRRIDLQVFAVDAERSAVGAYADTRPLAARPEIGFPFGDAIHPRLSPPTRHLVGVGERLEDALGRSGDKDFGFDRVVVGRDGDGGHGAS
jgi:hypothetical protein